VKERWKNEGTYGKWVARETNKRKGNLRGCVRGNVRRKTLGAALWRRGVKKKLDGSSKGWSVSKASGNLGGLARAEGEGLGTIRGGQKFKLLEGKSGEDTRAERRTWKVKEFQRNGEARVQVTQNLKNILGKKHATKRGAGGRGWEGRSKGVGKSGAVEEGLRKED